MHTRIPGLHEHSVAHGGKQVLAWIEMYCHKYMRRYKSVLVCLCDEGQYVSSAWEHQIAVFYRSDTPLFSFLEDPSFLWKEIHEISFHEAIFKCLTKIEYS